MTWSHEVANVWSLHLQVRPRLQLNAVQLPANECVLYGFESECIRLWRDLEFGSARELALRIMKTATYPDAMRVRACGCILNTLLCELEYTRSDYFAGMISGLIDLPHLSGLYTRILRSFEEIAPLCEPTIRTDSLCCALLARCLLMIEHVGERLAFSLAGCSTEGSTTTVLDALKRSIELDEGNIIAWDTIVTVCIDSASGSLPSFCSRYHLFGYYEAWLSAATCSPDRIDEVVSKVNEAISRFPTDESLKWALCLALANGLRYDEAEVLFEELYHVNSASTQLSDVYAHILLLKGKARELAELALRCTKCSPLSWRTKSVLGDLSSMKGNRDEAIQWYKQATVLNPTSAQCWTLLGHEYLEMKDAQGAMRCYCNSIAVAPTNGLGFHTIGRLLEMSNKPDSALCYYAKSLEVNGRNARVRSAAQALAMKMGVGGAFLGSIHCD